MKKPSVEFGFPFPVGEAWKWTGGPHNSREGGNKPHPWAALDFARPGGMVVAAADGVVFTSPYCPNMVIVKHADGWQTGYYHLTNILVQTDQVVQRGQALGFISNESGCGGVAYGAHVHFSIRRNGVAQNLNGFKIGGWTIRESRRPYGGYMMRGNEIRYVQESIYNDGKVK